MGAKSYEYSGTLFFSQVFRGPRVRSITTKVKGKSMHLLSLATKKAA